MKSVIQRVKSAKVAVDGKTAGQTGAGLLVYLGVVKGDRDNDAEFMAEKISNLRIFCDEQGKMNLSTIDIGGSVLLISNFTLAGNCQKGRRPSFDDSEEPGLAEGLYEKVAELIRKQGVEVQTGVFGAKMLVDSVNDGPVTFVLDSRK